MKDKIFPWIILFIALGLSTTAATYSVYGLSLLFAGASISVMVMGGFLEGSKLVMASLLYQYRKSIPKGLKWYLTSAVVILIIITSMGIYGFLSDAFQSTSNKLNVTTAEINLLETKRDNIKEQLAVYNEEKKSITEDVTNLRTGLSNNVIQYKDKETGQLITTTSSSTRRALEKQLDQTFERQGKINNIIDSLNTQVLNLEGEIVETTNNSELTSELGPLKYISDLSGWAMNKIVNILLIIIIFVFDPLAIALVITANFAFEKLKGKYKENIYGEKVKKENKSFSIYKSDKEKKTKNLNKMEEKKTDFENNSLSIKGLSENTTEEVLDQKETLEDEIPELGQDSEPEDENQELEDEIIVEDEIVPEKTAEEIEDDRLLNDPGISSWRKNKILQKRQG